MIGGWEGCLENEQIRIHSSLKAVAMAVGSFAGYSAMRALREARFQPSWVYHQKGKAERKAHIWTNWCYIII